MSKQSSTGGAVGGKGGKGHTRSKSQTSLASLKAMGVDPAAIQAAAFDGTLAQLQAQVQAATASTAGCSTLAGKRKGNTSSTGLHHRSRNTSLGNLRASGASRTKLAALGGMTSSAKKGKRREQNDDEGWSSAAETSPAPEANGKTQTEQKHNWDDEEDSDDDDALVVGIRKKQAGDRPPPVQQQKVQVQLQEEQQETTPQLEQQAAPSSPAGSERTLAVADGMTRSHSNRSAVSAAPSNVSDSPTLASVATATASTSARRSPTTNARGTRVRTSSLLPRDGLAGANLAAPQVDRHHALAVPEGATTSGGRELRRSATESGTPGRRTARRGSLQLVRVDSADSTLSSLLSSFGERQRTASTQSLTAADAAKLASQLRKTRPVSELIPTPASPAPTRSGWGFAKPPPADVRSEKPLLSVFATQEPSHAVAVPVHRSSVFAHGWSHATKNAASPLQQTERGLVRYVMPYALAGPPMEQNALHEALLAPALDQDHLERTWAPALANAARLGSRRAHLRGELAADGMPLGDLFELDRTAVPYGPNATPLHIIHGLTSVSDDPFPLDSADLPPSASALPPGHTMRIPPAAMRAIAMTVQAHAVARHHTLTRRFHDPFRDALDRLARPPAMSVRTPQPPPTTPSSEHAPSYAAQLVDAAEHPVRSLKRVWSGGLARGGLAALTTTLEEG